MYKSNISTISVNLGKISQYFENKDIDKMMKQSQDKFMKSIGGSEFGGGAEMKKLLMVLVAIVSCAWLSTGFYTLQPDEQGVILRFGKYNRLGAPGLNYKIPNPIETVTKVSVTRINREEIGGTRVRMQGAVKGVQESQMLTGDENIVNIDFDVQWSVKDAGDYLFNVRDLDCENTVRSTAESVMRDVIANSKISDAIAGERSSIELEAKRLLQEALDSYKMGVDVVRLQMLRVEPPAEVIDAYRDVQSAKADHERQINKAIAYINDIIPRARGEAAGIIQEAEGYKQQKISDAGGDAARFLSIYKEYANAKNVTRTRMYYDTMEEVLQGTPKIIVDKNNPITSYLPLAELTRFKAPKLNKSGPSDAEIRELTSKEESQSNN